MEFRRRLAQPPMPVNYAQPARETKPSAVFITQQTGTVQIICRVHPLSRYSSMLEAVYVETFEDAL